MVLGPHHSAVIVDPGVVYTFGRNAEGQLGMGNTKPREAPAQVRSLSDKCVTVSGCTYEKPIPILSHVKTLQNLCKMRCKKTQ